MKNNLRFCTSTILFKFVAKKVVFSLVYIKFLLFYTLICRCPILTNMKRFDILIIINMEGYYGYKI